MTHGTPALHGDALHDEHAHDHPGESIYIRIAIMLSIITVIEVAIYYIQWVHDKSLLVPTLTVLSIFKFFTVIGYFMHLKFDDRRLSYVFAGGLFVALSVVIALKVLLDNHTIDVAQTFIEPR